MLWGEALRRNQSSVPNWKVSDLSGCAHRFMRPPELLKHFSPVGFRLSDALPSAWAWCQPASATPKTGRLLGQAGLQTLRFRRASTAGPAGESIGTAQPHAQKRVLFRPRVRHFGSPANSHCLRTDTAGPRPSHVAHRSRQAVLRACSLAVEVVEATTVCTTSK